MDPDVVLERYSKMIDFSSIDASVPTAYTDTVVGIFSGVTKLAVLLALVVQMFRYAWQPFFLNHAKDADAKPLFGRVFTLFVAGILLVFLGVSFFVDDLVSINLPRGYTLIKESYWVGLYVVPILLLGYVFQGLYYNFSAGAYIQQKTKYFLYCALGGGAVSLILNTLFVPTYGMIAAAWATAAAYITMSLSLFVLIQRKYPIPYDWKRVLGIAVLAVICFAAWSRFEMLQSFWMECMLILGYVVGIFVLGIVRIDNLRQFLPSR
jgi:O-antigen/teichoic acid export membrane protein